ncbi:MAG: hypothetical protein ND895_14890 [Pyrinomonadaceae bacterium]|nr:hypothetical protein [Pyrinomonadaceae bacterium]
MNRLFLTLTLVVGILFTTAWAQQPRNQWEYKFEFNVTEKKANALGAEGWELVTASAPASGSTSNVETFVFKRAK